MVGAPDAGRRRGVTGRAEGEAESGLSSSIGATEQVSGATASLMKTRRALAPAAQTIMAVLRVAPRMKPSSVRCAARASDALARSVSEPKVTARANLLTSDLLR